MSSLFRRPNTRNSLLGSMKKRESILTLEPLLEAVREGLENERWELSGMQKTTSHEFEGRWAGDSSRSAYLFFHRPESLDDVSIDVFLDETSQGLRANLALVFDAPPLGSLPSPTEVLDTLRMVASRTLPEGYTVPISVRLRGGSARVATADVETEVRVKLVVPRGAFEAGHGAVASLATSTARALEAFCVQPEIRELMLTKE
jgi:hypothetical protein